MTRQLDMFAPTAPEPVAVAYVAQSPFTHTMTHRNCRSCGALIWWAHTEAGRRMPVDYQPDPRGLGNVVFTDAGQVRYLKRNESGPDGPRYTSHFATCPQAEEHRKRNTPVTAQIGPTRAAASQQDENSSSNATANLEAQVDSLADAYLELLEQNRLLENQIQPLVEQRDRISWQKQPWPEGDGDRLLELGGEISQLRHQQSFRRDSMQTIAQDLRPLLDERDRTARGAFAAGANRPVVMRLSDRARDRRSA